MVLPQGDPGSRSVGPHWGAIITPCIPMSSGQLKTGYFVLEGLNSFATVYYCYYLFFYMHETFGFGNQANLELAALSGFVCIISAWMGGKFAQRSGYFTALKLGFATMCGAL